MKILLLLTKVRQLLPITNVFATFLYLTGCNYNSFLVGQWEMDKQKTFSQTIFTYDLKSDHTGSVNIITPPIVGSGYEAIHWTFDGTVLTATSNSPVNVGSQLVNLHDVLTLIDHTGGTVTWKDQNGTNVE